MKMSWREWNVNLQDLYNHSLLRVWDGDVFHRGAKIHGLGHGFAQEGNFTIPHEYKIIRKLCWELSVTIFNSLLSVNYSACNIKCKSEREHKWHIIIKQQWISMNGCLCMKCAGLDIIENKITKRDNCLCIFERL